MSSHVNHGAHKHQAQLPFVDVHCGLGSDGYYHLEGVLPFDTIENLAVGMAIDASKSFQDEYGKGGISRLLGLAANQVDQAMGVILPYLVKMDSTKSVWVTYWAVGESGTKIAVVDPDEMTAEEALSHRFDGPNGDFGGATYFLPALREFITHLKLRIGNGERIDKALLCVVTDGQWHDLHEVGEYVEQLEAAIARGDLPKLVVSVVGVGDQVSEDMLEELLHDTEHEDAPSAAFCYNMLSELPDLAGIVAHLADAQMYAFQGGAVIEDDQGNLLASWEDDVPVFIELKIPSDVEHIVFKAQGQQWEVELDADDDHGHGEEDHEDEDHHEPAGHHGHR